jgi:hypothetical protein
MFISRNSPTETTEIAGNLSEKKALDNQYKLSDLSLTELFGTYWLS